MASYVVRIELKGDPASTPYQRLHESMAARGFLMQAEGRALPHATYFGMSDKSADTLSSELLDLIKHEIQYDGIVAVAQTDHVSVNGTIGGASFREQLGSIVIHGPTQEDR